MSMRIDIKTNFTEDWYKAKFKSGFLNKMIDTVKTEIHKNADTTRDNQAYRDKKYDADTM